MKFDARPVTFGKASHADRVPRPLVGKAAVRRHAALSLAGDVLTVLPGPSESLHAIMTGRYDVTDLLQVIFDKLGAISHLRIATLSFNTHNLTLLQEWIRSGTVKRLTLLYSLFFQEHNPEIVQEMRAALGEQHRTAASRNHCKLVTMDFATGRKWTMEGSANLRTNSNREQVTITDSEQLHDWTAAYIDREVSTHEAKKYHAQEDTDT
jgi:hypothetical protein